jgi:hypothetical protein
MYINKEKQINQQRKNQIMTLLLSILLCFVYLFHPALVVGVVLVVVEEAVAGCGSSGWLDAPLLAPLRALLSRPVVGISRYDLFLLLNCSAIGLLSVLQRHPSTD